MRCPKCGGADVRESHVRSLRDGLLELFGLVAYRCRACRNRFHQKPANANSEEELDEEIVEAGDEPDKGTRR
jgi:hypothetical protein